MLTRKPNMSFTVNKKVQRSLQYRFKDTGTVCRWVWMVVRFVCVIRVPVCARVSRACPVCVPAPPGVFLPVQNRNASL